MASQVRWWSRKWVQEDPEKNESGKHETWLAQVQRDSYKFFFYFILFYFFWLWDFHRSNRWTLLKLNQEGMQYGGAAMVRVTKAGLRSLFSDLSWFHAPSFLSAMNNYEGKARGLPQHPQKGYAGPGIPEGFLSPTMSGAGIIIQIAALNVILCTP